MCAASSLRAETLKVSGPEFILNSGNGDQHSAPSVLAEPAEMARWGYNGCINPSSLTGVQTFESVVPGLFPKGSDERTWIDRRAAALDRAIKEAHSAGIKYYAGTDVIVLPKALVNRFHSEISDDKGRIDIALPKTRELLAAMLRETFERFPDLDGVIIRTGEVYLQDFPWHTASGKVDNTRVQADAAKGTQGQVDIKTMQQEGKIQSNTAIIHGPQSHIDILNILREEVCVKRNKTVIYRTWDFRDFHIKPEYYLAVTNAVQPHPKLVFSVKHQKGDFHQLTPFNPTLMIGNHRQIVEVQSQREAYGKGAHPYYIGQGVIDGWEEYAWMMKPNEPKGLRDIVHNPLFAGVWTWTRGGGWNGPYIHDEFWCLLNSYVVAKYVQDPSLSEENIFRNYAAKIGLEGKDIDLFRELNLASAKAVLRGQLTCLDARVDVWWARDDTLGSPDLAEFVKKGLVEKALAEKAEAVNIWKRIETLSGMIHFRDKQTADFVTTSATYGRIKHSIIEQLWTVILYGNIGEKTGTYDTGKISRAISTYDSLWQEWESLSKSSPSCSSLYTDKKARDTVEHYRRLLEKIKMSSMLCRKGK
jgi:hypothetical protein